MEDTKNCNKKRIRQPISVPFLWEVKPGLPNKDWKPVVSASVPVEDSSVVSSVSPALLLPVKFVPSVPFKWEEKPGKPLPYFPVSSVELGGGDDNGADGDDEGEGVFELDLESFGFDDMDDSFSSAPSLLANCLVSSMAISTATPIDGVCAEVETDSSTESESDSSTSSYATGASSLVGASFLESLFPLLPPNTGFLKNVENSEDSSVAPMEMELNNVKHFECESNIGGVIRRPPTLDRESNTSGVIWRPPTLDRESNTSGVIRRTPTLGELIMMSRRRSYRRKAMQMRKHNPSMEFMKKRAFGCGLFKTTIKMIEGLNKKKMHQPVLKLM